MTGQTDTIQYESTQMSKPHEWTDPDVARASRPCWAAHMAGTAMPHQVFMFAAIKPRMVSAGVQCPIPAIFRQKMVIWQNAIGHFRAFPGVKMGRISQSFGDIASISPFFHNVRLPPAPGGRAFPGMSGHHPDFTAATATKEPRYAF